MMRQSVTFCCFCSFFSVTCMQQGANDAARELALQVVELRGNFDVLAIPGSPVRPERTLAAAHETLNSIRRGVAPQRDIARGMHPRVRASVDAVLAAADEKVNACAPLCASASQRSSLSVAEKRTVVAAQLIRFKQLLNGLFVSVDCEARLCGDEPRIATHHVKCCAADGTPLALVEAGEQFAQAVNRMSQPCASCSGCSRDLWCAECKESVQPISGQDLIERCAHETTERVGVDDAFTYLASRVGALSGDADVYDPNASSVSREHFDRVQSLASARKNILEWCAAHKVTAEALNTMSDDQLKVESILPLLENASGTIGFAESAVQTARNSYNPLKFIPAQLFCRIALGNATAETMDMASKELAKNNMTLASLGAMVRENVTLSLGITEKELPILAQLMHLFASPANKLALQGAAWIKDSSPAIDAFARDYSRPVRDQYLTPASAEALQLMAHAWKTRGVVRPQAVLRVVETASVCEGAEQKKASGSKLEELD